MIKQILLYCITGKMWHFLCITSTQVEHIILWTTCLNVNYMRVFEEFAPHSPIEMTRPIDVHAPDVSHSPLTTSDAQHRCYLQF